MKFSKNVIIGAFVIGAFLLFSASLFLFAGSSLFDKREVAVTFFEGSVKNLRQGAQVTFRGVKVGQVKDIKLIFSPSDNNFHIAVYFQFDPETLGRLGKEKSSVESLPGLLERGLRARLEVESIVTGLLYLNLDFFPERQARLLGLDSEVREIPSIPSRFEEVGETLQRLPIEDMINDVRATLSSIRKVFDGDRVDTLLNRGEQMTDTVNNAARKAEQLIEKLGTEVPPVIAELTQTIRSVREGTERAQEVLKKLNNSMEDTSPVRREIEETLDEWNRAGRSLRQLVDAIERNPEMFLRGKRAEQR